MNYAGQSVLLASKHEKERAIEPVFKKKLGCTICVEEIDTDQFGTFTGEIPRKLSAYETCVLKATYAAEEKKYSLSIASEGSFGPDPAHPFIAHAHEIMVFVDLAHKWTISEQLSTHHTNYSTMKITRETPLDAFLKSALFPSHALTLQSGDRQHLVAKGIHHDDQLHSFLSIGFEQYSELLIATDMRAMMNPTRMKTLEELATKLANRIQNLCPRCHTPGFGFQSVTGHLPCHLCGNETQMYRYEEWGCIACDYQERHLRKDQLTTADPTYCDYCNP